MNVTTHPRSRTVGRALLAVVLLATIAPSVVYAVPGTVGAEASYIVLTASMTPAIAPGDVVVVDDVPARLIEEGDVVVFEQQAGADVPVTHRVIAVERAADGTPSFVTKGDANEDADLTPVTPDRLVGRVLFTIPLIGHVIQFVGTPTGFVALVVLPLGLLIALEVVDLLRSGRSSDAAAVDGHGDDGDDDDGAVVDDPSDDFPAGTDLDEQFTVTPADLTLASVVLAAFTAYAAYAAYQRPTGLTVAVAVAVGATFALAVGVRSFAPPAPATSDGHPAAEAVAVTRIDRGPSTGPTVEVATPADLRAVAAAVGRPLLSVPTDRLVVIDGTVTYACAVPTTPEDGEDGASDPADAPETAADGREDDADADADDEARPYGPVPPRADDEAPPALTPDGGADR